MTGVGILLCILYCWKKVFAMTSTFSWQNAISLCPASFRIPRPNLPVPPGVFLTSYFCIPVPYNENNIFFGLVLKGLVQFSSVARSYPTLCDPMNCSMPGLPVHHQLPEFTQTHVHRVGDAN